MLEWSQQLPFADLVMIMSSLTTNFTLVSSFLALAHWAVYCHDGTGILVAYITSRLLWNLSKATMMFTFFMLARGDKLTTPQEFVKQQQLRPLATLAVCLSMMIFAIEMLSYFSYSDDANATSAFDSPLGVILIGIDLIAGWKYIESMSSSLRAPVAGGGISYQKFLQKYGVVMAFWFLTLPIAVFVSHVAHPWERFRTVTLISGVLHIAYVGFSSSVLRPTTMTQNMFRSHGLQQNPDKLTDLEDTGIV
eukprot:Filipodium_phascolosomae@DN1568_c0_g1_i1.p1